MPNVFKFNTSTDDKSLKKGNFSIGVGDVPKGPSSVTGFYQGITPPVDGWMIYKKIDGDTLPFRIYSATQGSLVNIVNRIEGKTFSQIWECLNHYALTSSSVIVNKDFAPIVTDGLVLMLDASNVLSYPATGSSWYDISAGANNGTLQNSPTFDDVTGSIFFDATNESCEFPNGTFNTSSPQNGSFRIIVKIPTLSTTATTVIFYDGGTTNNLIYFYRNAPWTANTYAWLIYYTKNDDSTSAILPTFIYSPNTWYDLTFTFNDTGQYRVYSNGVLLNTTNASNFLSWNRIGNNTPNIRPASNQGAGNAALFQWYNRAISTDEILQNYYRSKIQTSGLSMIIDAQNLVSNETQTTITDLTSSKYVFTYEDTVTKSSDFGGTLRLAPGRIYRSVITWYGNYTFGFWFKSVGSPTFGRFYTESNRGPSGCARVYSNMNSNGTFIYRVWDNSSIAPLGGGERTATSITNVQNGDWHFITCIWSNGSSNRSRGLYLFVNGTLEASQDMIGNDGSYQHLHLGGSSGCIGTASFDCYLGPIMQYSNLAMNDGQVKDLYESYKTRYQ